MGIGRKISVITGTVVLIGVATYAPLTLLAPVPEASVEALSIDAPAGPATELPTSGQAALANADGTQILAAGGTAEAVPIAGLARALTALIVLEAKPVSGDDRGPAVPVTSADFDRQQKLEADGFGTVPVFPGDTWTERDALEAILLGGSNNHAELLSTWAFGSADAFRVAAEKWLTEHGLTDTVLADATGLSSDSVSTAPDLARAAALLGTNPVLGGILTHAPGSLASERGVRAQPARITGDGLTVLQLGYTERAGFGLLALDSVPTSAGAFPIGAASLRSDTWASLQSETEAAQKLAREAVTASPIVEPGTAVAVVRSPWGDSARAITGESKAVPTWRAQAATLTLHPKADLSLFAKDESLGTVVAAVGDEPGTTIGLSADAAILPPSLGWRLTHPVELIGPWLGDLIGFRER